MYFAFTIKLTRGKPSKHDYNVYLRQMLTNNPSIKLVSFNWEKTRGLHVHGLLFKRGPIGYSDLINVQGQRGVNILIKEVYNLAGWKWYQEKDEEPGDVSELVYVTATAVEADLPDTKEEDSGEEIIDLENCRVNLTPVPEEGIEISSLFKKRK